MDTREFLNGKATDAYIYFGSVKKDQGYIFRVLAPNAKEVHIIGDFNDWTPSKMRSYKTGIHSLTNKDTKVNDRYQYIITDKNGNTFKKVDPFAREINTEDNVSVITDDSYKFKNKKIKTNDLNIYQVHLGAIFNDSIKSIEEHLKSLISHVKNNNFSHVMLMPINEYRSYKSYGYVANGFYAVASRYGNLRLVKEFVDLCHGQGIGVIAELDISQFDSNNYGLSNFDGNNLYNYDYEDIYYNYYGGVNFDFTKNTTKSFLKSLVNFYTNEFNMDGINLSNLENIIYWQGDKSRGINKQGFDFIIDLIKVIKQDKSLALASFNGDYSFDLGFDYVFDNSLRSITKIFQKPAFIRNDYKNEIYKLLNLDNTRKILGFDYVDSFTNEASLAMKIEGEEKFKQLKNYLTLVYTIHSKKQLFMGDEYGDLETFSVFDKFSLDSVDDNQSNLNKFYKDLSDLYLTNEVLNNKTSKTKNLDIEGYSIYAYKRIYDNKELLVIINLTDISYNINSPYKLEEILNSEDLDYGGSGNINGIVRKNDKIKIMPYGSAVFKIKKG